MPQHTYRKRLVDYHTQCQSDIYTLEIAAFSNVQQLLSLDYGNTQGGGGGKNLQKLFRYKT